MIKYRLAQYAEALSEALEGKSVVQQRLIARNFARLLVRHHMLGKSDAILVVYEKLALRRQGVSKVKIETPSTASEQLKKEIRAVLGKKIHFQEVINPDLLAGVKILVDDELLIDASAKRQLEGMLRH